jgi:uncharacterized delta-60 repeat protein
METKIMWLSFSRKQHQYPHPRSFRPRLESLEDRCLLSGGVLDPTFGSGGMVTTSVGSFSKAYAVTTYPNAGTANDGKVVAAGYTAASNGDKFAIVRYNLDGTLDRSFGGSGQVVNPAGVANDVKVQPDGKIVAAGDSGNNFAVVRYNADGSLDSTFGGKGGKGQVLTDIGQNSNDGGERLALQRDGKIVVAGFTAPRNTSNFDLALVRYNADGSLDTSFGNGGKVIQHFTSPLAWQVEPGFLDMAIDPAAGKIVVGAALAGQPLSVVLRFNTNGNLDTSFGGSAGFVPTPSAVHVAVQSDDRIVVAGRAEGGAATGSDIAITRLNADGTPDTTFGSGGRVVTPLPGEQGVRSLTIQPDGKIVVAGNQNYYNLMVARYNGADGSLDTSFGINGLAVTTGNQFADEPVDVALEPDGRIIVGGASGYPASATTAFTLARFLATGPQIGSFTASPNPATTGSSVTLTASNVVALNPGSTVSQVAFYVDSNGDGVLDAGDALVGCGSQSSTGTWTLTFATAGWATGSYQLFAQAEDSYGAFSDPLALTLALQ